MKAILHAMPNYPKTICGLVEPMPLGEQYTQINTTLPRLKKASYAHDYTPCSRCYRKLKDIKGFKTIKL